jgi:hypothetical protein
MTASPMPTTPKNGTRKALITVGCLGLPKCDKARVRLMEGV